MRKVLYAEAEASCNNPYAENIWLVTFFRPSKEQVPQQRLMEFRLCLRTAPQLL
jgi:hypothetical protein